MPPLDTAGKDVRGVLKVGDELIPLKPGEVGPGKWLVENLEGGKGSGLTFAWKHVEGHAAGLMRKHDLLEAELFINKAPCGAGAAMCRFVTNKLIPPNSTLKVNFPDASTGQIRTWLFEHGVPKWKELK